MVPAAVPLINELAQSIVLSNCGRNFEASGEGVHSADVGVEEVHGIEAFSTHFSVEIHPARCDATVFE